MNMFKVLKENMNKFINKVCENTKWNEVMKTIQLMKVQIELLKKTQTEAKLKKKFRKSNKNTTQNTRDGKQNLRH